MSTEQQLAAVVSAANNLTGVVTSKVDEIDKALAEARRKYDEQIVSLDRRLPRLATTKNFIMAPDASGALIEDWAVHREVAATKLRTITQVSQDVGRPHADVDFMYQVQADVREQFPEFNISASEHWRNPIHVWQMKWSANSEGAWLAFPYAIDSGRASGGTAMALNTHMTIGAFVRVIDGAVSGLWTNGNEKGKWRWCSVIYSPTNIFGHYINLHPRRVTAEGVIEVMLAGTCTGVVTHPADWGTMLALG